MQIKSNVGFWGEGKPQYPDKNRSERSREPTNSTHIWCQVWESNPGLTGWRQVLSPPCQLCTHKKHSKVCADAQSAAFRKRSTDSPPAATADVEAPWVEWPEYPNSIPAIHKGLINHRETDWLEMALCPGDIKHTSSWKDLHMSLVLSTYAARVQTMQILGLSENMAVQSDQVWRYWHLWGARTPRNSLKSNAHSL